MIQDMLRVSEETVQAILKEFSMEEQTIINRFNKRLSDELEKNISEEYVTKQYLHKGEN